MAGDDRVRFTGRISESDMELMKFWAEHEGENITEFVECAIQERLDRLRGMGEPTTLGTQRLNQLSDGVLELINLTQAMSREMHEGFSSLLGVMRFGDYVSVDEEE